MIKVKIIENAIVAPAELEVTYELFDSKVTKDINDNDVTLPVSLGRFKKSHLQKQIDALQEKLDAITAIE